MNKNHKFSLFSMFKKNIHSNYMVPTEPETELASVPQHRSVIPPIPKKLPKIPSYPAPKRKLNGRSTSEIKKLQEARKKGVASSIDRYNSRTPSEIKKLQEARKNN